MKLHNILLILILLTLWFYGLAINAFMNGYVNGLMGKPLKYELGREK